MLKWASRCDRAACGRPDPALRLSPDEIPIVYTGLRPREKLEEVLWEEDAQLEDTAHPEVLKVTERRSPDAQQLARAVEALANAAVQGDRSGIELGLRELIPSFSPNAQTPSRTSH